MSTKPTHSKQSLVVDNRDICGREIVIRGRFLVALITGATLSASCVAATGQPITAAQPKSDSAGFASTQKLNLDDFAPPARGRDLLIQNCNACHSFACAIRGRRTLEHIQNIKRDMRDKVSGLTDEDYDTLFAYLEENFDNTKPEPKLPPQLVQQGCSTGAE